MVVEVDIEIDDLCESYVDSVALPLISSERAKVFRGAKALINKLDKKHLLEFLHGIVVDNSLKVEFLE